MENCSSLEPWAFRSVVPETGWMAEAFARDNEALTKALQFSLSDDPSAALHQIVKRDPAFVSPSDLARSPFPCSPSGKITKRKPRGSKRSPTTYISADPANFRQLVQEVTGVRAGGAVLSTSEPVLKPESQLSRVGRAAQQSCLPTLDTSAFFLGRAASASGTAGPVAGQVAAFDFELCSSFPTLESWRVM